MAPYPNDSLYSYLSIELIPYISLRAWRRWDFRRCVRWSSSGSLNSGRSTEFCLDFEAAASYLAILVDFKLLVGVIVAEDVDVLVAAILAPALGHFRARDHDLSVPDLSLYVLLGYLAHDHINYVIFFSWISKTVRLNVIAEKVTTTTQLLDSTLGTLMSMACFVLT